ncbi:MAG: insulinase family protein [Armatimonadetes bacterium]|nr:insulinase family protein [Armatimonadota bacterium]
MKPCSNSLLLFLIAILSWTAAVPSAAAESHQRKTSPKASRTFAVSPLPIKTWQLENGLRIVVSLDHSAPVSAVAVYYDVGARNEKPGKSGFAHLFEHMMFEGSENVGKGEHFKHIHEAGGNTNGSTTSDRTNYFEVLPSNRTALGIWLEADRMRSLKVTKENFENQRETVKEERRMRIDNQAYGQAWLRLTELAFRNFAYSHPVIGSMEDLNRAPLSDVQEFFATYYVPGNAVLVVVGDVNPNQVHEWAKLYFGRIPGKPIPAPVTVAEPPQTEEKRETIVDRNAKIPAALIAYHIPERRHPDYYPLTILEQILADGKSCRLYRRLVREAEVATTIGGGVWPFRGPSLFTFFTRISGKETAHKAVTLIQEELNQIKQTPPTQMEMIKAKNKLRAQFLFAREKVLDRALEIAEYALYDKDPGLINTELHRFLSVTPEQVSEVTRKYFETGNRTVIEVHVQAPTESRREENPR